MSSKNNWVKKNSRKIRQQIIQKQKTVFIIAASGFVLLSCILIALMNFTGTISLFAATAGDYRSVASGNWNTPGNWEKFNGISWMPAVTSPSNLDGAIIIQTGHTINITSAVTIDEVVVNSGGQLSVSTAACTIANGINADLTIDGTLNVTSSCTLNTGATAVITGLGICSMGGTIMIGGGGACITIDMNGVFRKDGGTITTTANTWIIKNGGTYRNNDGSAIPIATWNVGSTCEINKTIATVPGNFNQTFYNLIWNNTSQTTSLNFGGAFPTVNGDLTIASTGNTFIQLDYQGNNTVLNVAKNLIITGGKLFGCTNGGTRVNVTNNYIQTGGYLSFNMAGGTAYGNTSMIMNVNGDALISGGTFDMSQCTANNSAKGNGVLNLKGNMILSGAGLVTETSSLSRGQVNFAGTIVQYFKSENSVTRFVDFTVNNAAILRMDDQVLTGSGKFTLMAGGGLMMGHKDGITLSSPAGNIQLTGTRSFSIGGDYTYNGLVAQNSGNGLPVQVHNFTLDNNKNLTLTNSSSVSNILTFTIGLVIATNDTLTLGISTAVRGTLARTTGHVVGYFKRWIGNVIANNILFPVGTLNFYNGANFSFTTAPIAGSIVSCFVTSSPGTLGLPLMDAGELCNNIGYAYWSFGPMNGFNNGGYTVNLYANGFPGINDYTKLHILRRAGIGSPWVANGTHIPGTGSNTSPVANRLTMNLTGHYTITGPDVNPLPIELLFFNAELKGRVVDLSWTTATEKNNDYFSVERSTDAKEFSELLRKQGAGNSTTKRNYTAIDEEPLTGYSYYRLRQTDFDGVSTFSEIVAVKNQNRNYNFQIISVTPANFSQKFSVVFTEKPNTEIKIEIISSAGQVVFRDKIITTDKNTEYNFNDETGLSNGIYFLNLYSGNEKLSKRILKY
jgi:hypothetical protein